MKDNFQKCLALMLAHEGGYVHHEKDPGGRTNLGVTQRVWEEWTGHEVDEKQMRALTPEAVAPLYKRKYWDACRADELVSGLDYAVFDCAVNSGPGRAIKFLQSCVGVNADGGFGPTTMAAVAQFQRNTAKTLIKEYCEKRLDFLKSLKTFETFGKGWERRVNEVKDEALRMANATI
jgi:lysozyme family protein